MSFERKPSSELNKVFEKCFTESLQRHTSSVLADAGHELHQVGRVEGLCASLKKEKRVDEAGRTLDLTIEQQS